MAKNIPGATVNGKKVYPKANVVEPVGHLGATRESAPKASQVANLNGKTYTTGQRLPKPGPSKPDLAANAAAERQNGTTGTTAEESKKRLAAKMYPSSSGLREFMPKFF